MALKLRPDMSALWHDLGVNHFRQVSVVDEVTRKVVADRSLQSLQKAVELSPSDHSYWSALGVVAASKGK